MARTTVSQCVLYDEEVRLCLCVVSRERGRVVKLFAFVRGKHMSIAENAFVAEIEIGSRSEWSTERVTDDGYVE